jgi:catechol 2,3-dioxygenase-like lactoylglutathione lyase family enzyme
MIDTSKVIAFVATADGARAKAFYVDVLGARFVADEPHALVLDLNGTMLRVQKVQSVTPQPFTVLGWEVRGIERVMASLVGRGVAFERYGFLDQDERGVWTTPDGAKIAWFKDPDGNTLSLTEWS